MIRHFVLALCVVFNVNISSAICIMGDVPFNNVLPIIATGKDTTMGSAFLWFDYYSSDSILLVTCKHTFENRDTVLIRFDCKGDGSTQSAIISFPLRDTVTERPFWFTSKDMNIDVAILRTPITRFTGHCNVIVQPIVRSQIYGLTPKDVGSTLSYIGFPLGFIDEFSNVPVIRSAMLCWASQNRLPIGSVLVEGHSAPGNSGSPVFIEPSCKFVGMMAGLIPSKKWVVRDSVGVQIDTAFAPSGLSYMVTAFSIQKVIDEHFANHK